MKGKLTILLTAVTLAVSANSAQATCFINLSVENSGNNEIRFHRGDSKVRMKGLPWRKLKAGGWGTLGVAPGKTKQTVYKAHGKCGARREYRFVYFCFGKNNERLGFRSKYTPLTKSRNVNVRLSC